ncbi:nitronate monooxygenase [bacterium]|nr:MAG: nitronate monooxygenase [bacterium]RKZ12769.1 MAG: nitronate monooxygenase [bacterium]
MSSVDNYRLNLGGRELVPIIVGGMGVDISTDALAREACRLGGIGHISDAMINYVSDKNFKTRFTQAKHAANKKWQDISDKSNVHFNLEDIRQAQLNHIRNTMDQKVGSGAIFVNIMEKLTMADPASTLRERLRAALDGGIDGITLSAGLHTGSLHHMEDHPRFRDAMLGIIVSSTRALKIFLRRAKQVSRMPDYIVVEGPLAGGHLGFGQDWKNFQLKTITTEVMEFLKSQDLTIPVIPAGGIFTGTDAVEYLESGSAAVQVATRFTVTEECGLGKDAQQDYFKANEDDVIVSETSPTGYLIRMIKASPSLRSNQKPMCESLGYMLDGEGKCAYIDAYNETPVGADGRKENVEEKMCLCYHFSKTTCYTCGHYVYRLKDTSTKNADGSYQVLSAEHVFKDYQFSKDHEIALPAAVQVG